jgi:O-antigen/teichoic acid export membrane protein
MASTETTPYLEEKAAPAPASAEAGWGKGWSPSAIVADIATLGTGTLLAGLFNVALVFVVPKLVSVEDYGYWRMFGLYAGYVGFVHFGFADGALLRWAGRPMEEFHHEIRPAMKYLFWQHVVVLAPLCAIAAVALRGPLQFVGIAVALYAVIFNEVTLLQFGLQSAKIFRPVAVSTVAAPALFLAFVLLWHAKWQSDYREVTGLYATGWLIALVFLLAWTKPWSGERGGAGVTALAKDCVQSGWPIVMANTGVMLIVFADRLAVSWAATIQNFAQYSLAASAMAVPITAIQASGKVFFSHLAGVTPEGRKRIYGISSRTLLVAWAILLPYYFGLGVFIRHFLPKYIPSLTYARILLLGIPFLAVIQILQMSYAYLNAIQKQFLARTTVVLAVSLGTTSFAAFHAGSLRIVAGVQVAILGGWWLFNESTLRGLTDQTAADWLRFIGVYGLASTSYWVTTTWTGHEAVFTLLYYSCLAVVLAVLCRDELRLWAKAQCYIGPVAKRV